MEELEIKLRVRFPGAQGVHGQIQCILDDEEETKEGIYLASNGAGYSVDVVPGSIERTDGLDFAIEEDYREWKAQYKGVLPHAAYEEAVHAAYMAGRAVK